MLISKKHKSLIFVGHDNFSSCGWVQVHQSAVLINLNAANHMIQRIVKLFHSNLLLVIYFFSRRVAFRTLSRFTIKFSWGKCSQMLTTYKSRREIFLDIEPHLIIKSFEFLQSTDSVAQNDIHSLSISWYIIEIKDLYLRTSPIKIWLNKISFKTRFKLIIYFRPTQQR